MWVQEHFCVELLNKEVFWASESVYRVADTVLTKTGEMNIPSHKLTLSNREVHTLSNMMTETNGWAVKETAFNNNVCHTFLCENFFVKIQESPYYLAGFITASATALSSFLLF